MATYTIRSSQPDPWIVPRPYCDPSIRRQTYGRIQPMEQPGFWRRVLGRA
ncbi:hypothetical protein [Qipengyuania thermophila]|nr:hypothetical protein [Qipengyuania thermophila]